MLTAARARAVAAAATIAVLAPGALQGGAAATQAGAATAAPRVFVVDDEVRLRRQDAARVRERGQPLAPVGLVDLSAFRGETVAFQVVVVAGSAAVGSVAVALSAFSGGGTGPRAEIFREHYLPVRARSRNDRRPDESLGWLPAARPLVPARLDAGPVAPGPAVPAGDTGATWIDVDVPETAAPGLYQATGEVSGDGAPLARFTLRVQVAAPSLPYRATSVFAFYEAERLDRRMGGGGAVERQLWRLLHAHHVDALAPLTSGADVRRLASAYDGSLFLDGPRAGDLDPYHGPGIGIPPAVVALGAYGILGDPRPDALARVDDMLAALAARPAATATATGNGGPADVFLYAIDETCGSPRAGDWKRALAGRALPRRLLVAQTCGDPPERQAVDVVLATPEAFPRGMSAAARAAGRRAWIYNGSLPRSGTLMLDADPRGLIANGWIAAVMDIERWFYWETIFWDDDNRGGQGPVDPFTTPEGFHNRDGDAALGDGLLLYPGRQRGPFAARSLGYEGVLPSLRLKQIRRGVEDAGIIALAARERPGETARIVAQAVPAALDEAPADRPAAWQSAPLRFAEARAALRTLVTRADPMTPSEIAAVLADQADRRQQLVPLAPIRRPGTRGRALLAACGILGAATLVSILLWRRRERRGPGRRRRS